MSKFDKTLDQILTSQMAMMDPSIRGKVERKKMRAEEKLRMLQQLTQRQIDSGGTDSGKEWMAALADIHKMNNKLPKKLRKKNKKYLQQLQETAAACNKGWKTVAEGRAARAAKF